MPQPLAGVFIQFPANALMDGYDTIVYFRVDMDGNHQRQDTFMVTKDSDFDAISLALRRRLLTDLRKSLP